MMIALQWLQNLPWTVVIFACLTLGLAPFAPPHIVEKIGMLARGELSRPIDIFDLFFHGIPWLLLIAKGVVVVTGLGGEGAKAS